MTASTAVRATVEHVLIVLAVIVVAIPVALTTGLGSSSARGPVPTPALVVRHSARPQPPGRAAPTPAAPTPAAPQVAPGVPRPGSVQRRGR